MLRDENDIRSSMHHLLDEISAQGDHFSKILQRMDSEKKSDQNKGQCFESLLLRFYL